MIRIHPSSLAKLMTPAKSKNDSDLSVGAITYCYELAKQEVYGYKKTTSSKYLDKGLIVEDQSIDLYNTVNFTNFKKNTERRTNEWLTGESDIVARNRIIDIKSSWSLETFPATKEECFDPVYEWQGRGYMMLWDMPLHEVAYCMVNTPTELIGHEDEEIHFVDHIDPIMRVTSIIYERDLKKEELIKIKVQAAFKKIDQLINEMRREHK